MKERITRRRVVAGLLLGAVAVASFVGANSRASGYGRGPYGSGGYGR